MCTGIAPIGGHSVRLPAVGLAVAVTPRDLVSRSTRPVLLPLHPPMVNIGSSISRWVSSISGVGLPSSLLPALLPYLPPSVRSQMLSLNSASDPNGLRVATMSGQHGNLACIPGTGKQGTAAIWQSWGPLFHGTDTRNVIQSTQLSAWS